VIPSHIGQYRIVRKIGAGGMGMVFLGEHILLGRRAAIKTLLPTVAVHREIVERFFNEARATSAISDPGVIQIFDFGYHVDGTAYIVMELLEGEALSARIDRLGKLAVADALRIARQIAGSLAAAHARGIVHRDLKPENIFLVCDAEAQGGERTKILDFGICKVDSAVTVTQSGTMIGTPVYMSPEQCRGAGGVDHRADIYAFGCLLFYMITGRPPFDADAPGDLIVAHMNATPVPPSSHVSDLPPEVDALLLRCLAKSPDDRFQSMTELQLTLGDLHAKLDGTEHTVSSVRPAMLLGRGFRSIYDASGGELNRGAPRQTPVTGALRAKWFERTPSTGPSPRHAGELEDDDDLDDLDLDLAPRRRGVRIALASVAIVGVVLGLLVTSIVTHQDPGEARGRAIPQAALPVEPEPAPPAGAPAAPEPAVASAPQPPTVAPAPAVPAAAPAAIAVTSAPENAPGPAREPAVAEAGSAKDAETAAVPRVAAEVPREIDHAAPAAPAAPTAPAAPAPEPVAEATPRSSREIKKPAARPRPRPRPVAATTRPASPAPTEDLYDTR
jgi:tRNA A-37 threonylcarbamoyl transferase component Bud32